MATSGSYDFSIDRDTLIKEALEILNAHDPIDVPTADEIFSCSRTLNMMLKAYTVHGLHLWKMETVNLMLQNDQVKYSLYPSGDNASIAGDWTETAVATEITSPSTTLVVDSTSGMTAGDVIGVLMDNDTWHWTTIASVTDGTTLELTVGVTWAAAVDSEVRFFTNKVQKPLKIRRAYYHDSTTGHDKEVSIISREEYYNLGNKTEEGEPNQIYVDPRIDRTDVYVYPEPDNVDDYLILICEYPFEDFDTGANTPDFPQEWYEAVTWGLAARLMYKYGATVTQDRRREITAIARSMLFETAAHDRENTSYFMQPHSRYLNR
jgi:hypothetical protein